MRRLKTPWKKQSRRQLLYVCNEINQINEINWVYIWRSWAHDWYLWLTPIHRPKFLSSVIFFPDLFVKIFSHFCLFWYGGLGVRVVGAWIGVPDGFGALWCFSVPVYLGNSIMDRFRALISLPLKTFILCGIKLAWERVVLIRGNW